MSRTPAIGFVLFCVFLDALGIGLIIPVLPRLIGVLAETRELQTVWYGAIMVSYGLMQFFFAPLLGALSDKIGRRPVLLGGIFGLALMMFVPALSDSLLLILLSRIAGGMMSSNIVVAQAYIADVTPAERRMNSFGKIGAIFGLAFVMGPALGGILGDANVTYPFLLAGSLCFVNFLYGLFILPESLASPNTAPLNPRRLNPLSAVARLARSARFRPLLVILTLFTLAQSVMQCTWALYTEYRYAWTPMSIGLSIFALGFSISLTQGICLPLLARSLSAERIIMFGLAVGLVSMVLIGTSCSGTFSLVMICLFAIMGVVGPAVQGIISRESPKDTQGLSMGAVSSINSFTGAISPLIGTPLLMITSVHPQHLFLAGAPYFFCALLIAVSLAVAVASLSEP